jgi:hypothetical protein
MTENEKVSVNDNVRFWRASTERDYIIIDYTLTDTFFDHPQRGNVFGRGGNAGQVGDDVQIVPNPPEFEL